METSSQCQGKPGTGKAIILANNNCLPVALSEMGNRPPSTTTVATVAALGAAAGYLAYAAYNYQQGDSRGQTPIAVEAASPASEDPVDDDVDQEEDELPGLVVEDSSHISAQTLIQTFCVAVLAVLMVITLVVSLLHSQVPTDLPMFAPLFWSTVGVGLTTSGIPFRLSNPPNAKKRREIVKRSCQPKTLLRHQPLTATIAVKSKLLIVEKTMEKKHQVCRTPTTSAKWTMKMNPTISRRAYDGLRAQLHFRFAENTILMQVMQSTKKISSTDPLYEVIHLTVRRTNAGEMLNVNDVQDLPECVVSEQCKGNGESKGMTGTIPNILLLHQILPVEQPSIWSNATKENSPSIHLLAYFKLSDRAKENILSNSNGSIASLLKTWIEPHDPLYDQWKTIIQLQNPEKVDIGMVGNQLIKQYNGKPFLSYGSADRDVFPNDKIVVTVDVYKFSYAMRNFYFSILQTEDPSVLNNAVVDMAFFLEGRVAAHLPEQILGSFAINDLRLLQ